MTYCKSFGHHHVVNAPVLVRLLLLGGFELKDGAAELSALCGLDSDQMLGPPLKHLAESPPRS